MSPAISHLMLGASGEALGDPHYDIGEDIESLSYAGNGVNTAVGNANNESVNDWISWSGMTGQADGGQFNRWVSHYSSTAWTSGGIAIASGHANTSDPLAARDVGFYYSTDTTNGTNGSWNIITPKNMVVAHCKKHYSASGYVGNRTSTIDSNHVKLSGNTIKEGWEGWQSRSNAYIYNRGNMNNGEQDSGNIFDVITWDPIPNVKGIRTDIRSKWDNGHYSGEKPHVADIRHFKAPVDGIIIDNLGVVKKENKIKKEKFLYSIKIADFYYKDSAENMVNRIKNETKIKNSIIKKLSKTKYRVLLGPFNDIKNLEKSFNEIKLLNFDNLEILKDV